MLPDVFESVSMMALTLLCHMLFSLTKIPNRGEDFLWGLSICFGFYWDSSFHQMAIAAIWIAYILGRWFERSFKIEEKDSSDELILWFGIYSLFMIFWGHTNYGANLGWNYAQLSQYSAVLLGGLTILISKDSAPSLPVLFAIRATLITLLLRLGCLWWIFPFLGIWVFGAIILNFISQWIPFLSHLGQGLSRSEKNYTLILTQLCCSGLFLYTLHQSV